MGHLVSEECIHGTVGSLPKLHPIAMTHLTFQLHLWDLKVNSRETCQHVGSTSLPFGQSSAL